jgi:hypothetical protein
VDEPLKSVTSRLTEGEEPAVNHIPLEAQDEAVQRFFLSLTTAPNGAVLELNGRAVACVLPVPPAGAVDDAAEEWTEAKNERRCDLIDREIAGTLTPDEAVELQRLQGEMLRHRRGTAPLPLDDARRLHQELLAKAAAASDAG